MIQTATLSVVSVCIRIADILNIKLLTSYKFCSPAYCETIYFLSYLIAPWSTVLLEKLSGSQTVNKCPTFYGTRKLITAFTRARHLSLS
jgi:hypothetical protein